MSRNSLQIRCGAILCMSNFPARVSSARRVYRDAAPALNGLRARKVDS